MTRSVIGTSAAAAAAPVASMNWASGVFGSGGMQLYAASGTYNFVVPAGVTSVRVRMWGAGGGGGASASYSGGGGGGFAMKTITALTSGASYTVTVGAGGGESLSGGTSSFGSFVSATGGSSAGSSSVGEHDGGVGVGGDVNYYGGFAGGSYSGGGGSASLFGHGRNSTRTNGYILSDNGGTMNKMSGGAGGGLGSSGSGLSVATQGSGVLGFTGGVQLISNATTDNASITRPAVGLLNTIDILGTGPGGMNYRTGDGRNGGGGFGGYSPAGNGGWPGGGGGAGSETASGRGLGADGCVILEY